MKFVPFSSLRFESVLKQTLWGGDKLYRLLGKGDQPQNKIGESWELGSFSGMDSIVDDRYCEGSRSHRGKRLSELIATYKGSLVGQEVYEKHRTQFPLLIKCIDATSDLSLQVHPSDFIAGQRNGSLGKTEMWYILETSRKNPKEEAVIFYGWKVPLSPKKVRDHLLQRTLPSALGKKVVQAGDVVYIPAGTVHAIGAGVLLVEIQQASDVTYRLYDWDRVDDEGNARQLHIEEALRCLCYDSPSVSYPIGLGQYQQQQICSLVQCPYFHTNLLQVGRKGLKRSYERVDSFVILIGVGGEVVVDVHTSAGSKHTHEGEERLLKKGTVLLLPAWVMDADLNVRGTEACSGEDVGEGRLLEVMMSTGGRGRGREVRRRFVIVITD